MKRTSLFLILICMLLLSGCSGTSAIDLAEEQVATFSIIDEAGLNGSTAVDTTAPDLVEKLEGLGFAQVAGRYTRIVTQEDIDLTELFAFEKNSFIRIAQNDIEQEVFAYNYASDNFTYLYYFDGDLMTKTKFNVDSGEVFEDTAGYAELLTSDARELKNYFFGLMDTSGINVSELITP